jgi:hypothetical protein
LGLEFILAPKIKIIEKEKALNAVIYKQLIREMY